MAGFGVLCRESGLTLGQAVFMTAAIWALPSQVVLVGAIASGASLPAAAIGVALSAVRFVPMIASWVPMVRRRERRRRWQIVAALAFRGGDVVGRRGAAPAEAARRRRGCPYFAGFAVTLTTLGTLVTGLGLSARRRRCRRCSPACCSS